MHLEIVRLRLIVIIIAAATRPPAAGTSWCIVSAPVFMKLSRHHELNTRFRVSELYRMCLLSLDQQTEWCIDHTGSTISTLFVGGIRLKVISTHRYQIPQIGTKFHLPSRKSHPLVSFSFVSTNCHPGSLLPNFYPG